MIQRRENNISVRITVIVITLGVLSLILLTCARETVQPEIQPMAELEEETTAGPLPDMTSQESEPPAQSPMEKPADKSTLPDFSKISDMTERKVAFFNFLRPIVRAENDRILSDRIRFIKLYDKFKTGKPIQAKERQWLETLQKAYHVESSLNKKKTWLELFHRVDVIPMELALTQAAIESQWGMSRFAIKGNSIFGKWCFEDGCGLVPRKREKGKNHLVQGYGSTIDSVRSYMHNLNTHRAYRTFRSKRHAMREEDKSLDSAELAGTLLKYSERGEEYVKDLKSMLHINRALMREGS